MKIINAEDKVFDQYVKNSNKPVFESSHHKSLRV